MATSKQRKKEERRGLGDIIGAAIPKKTNEQAEILTLGAAKNSATKSGKVTTSLYLPRAVHRQVRELAFAEDVKPHDIYLEALDRLFKQRGLKSIKTLTAL